MCHISDSQIKADGVVLANALTQIANVIPDQAIKADLLKAADGLVQVTNNWNGTNSKALFDDAMNAVTAVLARIPVTAPYAIFVSIAQSAIDLLWANVGNPPAPVTVSTVKATVAALEALPASPHRAAAAVTREHHESWRDALTRTWDTAVDEHPDAGVAKL